MADRDAGQATACSSARFLATALAAYLFDLIDKAARDDLRIIKSIRNNFAHTTHFVRFSTEHIAKDCRKLSNWTESASAEACYRDRAFECVKLIMGMVLWSALA
jgi:hypothetical protein